MLKLDAAAKLTLVRSLRQRAQNLPEATRPLRSNFEHAYICPHHRIATRTSLTATVAATAAEKQAEKAAAERETAKEAEEWEATEKAADGPLLARATRDNFARPWAHGALLSSPLVWTRESDQGPHMGLIWASDA